MFAILLALGMFVAGVFKSRCRLQAEKLFLRHQLNFALRRAPPRLRLRGSDRALLIGMIRLWPSLVGAVQEVQPESISIAHGLVAAQSCAYEFRNGQESKFDICLG